MADLTAVFGFLLLFGIAFPGLLTTWWLLFPGLVGRAQDTIGTYTLALLLVRFSGSHRRGHPDRHPAEPAHWAGQIPGLGLPGAAFVIFEPGSFRPGRQNGHGNHTAFWQSLTHRRFCAWRGSAGTCCSFSRSWLVSGHPADHPGGARCIRLCLITPPAEINPQRRSPPDRAGPPTAIPGMMRK